MGGLFPLNAFVSICPEQLRALLPVLAAQRLEQRAATHRAPAPRRRLRSSSAIARASVPPTHPRGTQPAIRHASSRRGRVERRREALVAALEVQHGSEMCLTRRVGAFGARLKQERPAEHLEEGTFSE